MNSRCNNCAAGKIKLPKIGKSVAIVYPKAQSIAVFRYDIRADHFALTIVGSCI